MIETHINIFDTIVIGIFLLSCLFAFFRGFVREILSLGAWIGAAIFTMYMFPHISDRLEPYFKSPKVAAGVGTIVLYFGALIGFSMFNIIILKFLKSGSDIGILDNLFGLVFGAFRGALIISLGFFLLGFALPEKEYPVWLKQSITRPFGEQGAVVLAKVAPDYLNEITTLQTRTIEEVKARKSQAVDASPASGGMGYNKQNSQNLDRLIQNTEKE